MTTPAGDALCRRPAGADAGRDGQRERRRSENHRRGQRDAAPVHRHQLPRLRQVAGPGGHGPGAAGPTAPEAAAGKSDDALRAAHIAGLSDPVPAASPSTSARPTPPRCRPTTACAVWRVPAKRRSRAGGAALPVRPLPADLLLPSRRRSPPTCRASGTTSCARRGAPTTRSTSTREMNYWPAETANLAECHQPLFGLADAIWPRRAEDRRRQLRRAAAGSPTTTPTSGAHRPGRRRRRRSGLGQLADGRRLALPAPLGALRLRRRPRVPARRAPTR